MKIRFAVVVIAIPAMVSAQAPVAGVAGALVKKSIPRSAITGGTETVLSTVPVYQGVACEGGCILARGTSKQNVRVLIRPNDPAVKLEEVRTTLVIPHGQPHSVQLTLDDVELLGLLCNGHEAISAFPKFHAMGAVQKGFKWARFDGSKMIASGHSNGESIKWDGDGKSMSGPMQLAVFSDGTVEVTHGTQRTVMTSDDSALIEQKSGASLQARDVMIRAADVAELAIISTNLQGVNR
jgi:hypothetical protein